MMPLVLADLRSRWRSLTAFSAGCFFLLTVLGGTYTAIGGSNGLSKAFGQGRTPRIFSAISGSSTANIFSPRNFLAFGFDHPLFLVLSLGLVISGGVAAVATDVETGRAELLFSLPIERTRILYARFAGCLIAMIAGLLCGVAGCYLGTRLSASLSGVSLLVPLRLAVQFAALSTFFAAVSFAASCFARSRGVALGISVAAAAGSYFLNLTALLWSPIAGIRHLDPFGYYDPTTAAAHIDWLDVVVLLAAATIVLLVARARLVSRDLA